MLLSILVPVYNEERTLAAILDGCRTSLLPAGLDREIIVINDGSGDGSRRILDRFCSDPVFRIFHHGQNRGKTAALRSGLSQCRGDIILIQDADAEYSPADHLHLVEPIFANRAAVVYGSRFQGTARGMTAVNRLANAVSNATFNALYRTRLSDVNTCLKAFRREVILPLPLCSQAFVFETEVTAKLVRRGHRILEVPVRYTARRKKDGKKITWPKALGMFWGIIRYRFEKDAYSTDSVVRKEENDEISKAL